MTVFHGPTVGSSGKDTRLEPAQTRADRQGTMEKESSSHMTVSTAQQGTLQKALNVGTGQPAFYIGLTQKA